MFSFFQIYVFSMTIFSKVVKTVSGVGIAGLSASLTYVYTQTPTPVSPDAYNRASIPRINREANLRAMEANVFDLIVIGGGATGSAVALDGASRGLKVAVIERSDFSSGTSSRSTKLLHGGVRYLKDAFFNFDFGLLKLVYEALRERSHMLAASPHISQPLAILIPLYTYFDVAQYYCGIKAYEFAAEIATLFNTRIPGSYMLGKSASLYTFPLLRPEGLKAGLMYFDGQHNDSRVNMLMALTASVPDYIPGWEAATIANHLRVTKTIAREGQLSGVECVDTITGEKVIVTGKVVINATGPFADSIRQMANPELVDLIIPAGGVHIVMPRLYSPPTVGLLIPETSDGRVLFYLPWENNTCVGTTDAKSALTELPVASTQDVDFIVNESAKYLNIATDKAKEDVTAAWCGIRPLVRDPESKDTSKLSRDHVVEADEKSGLITIAGGKWTKSRLMAEHTVDKALAVHRGKIHAKHPCRTWMLKLVGTDEESDETSSEVVALRSALALSRDFGIEYDDATHLVRNYGGVHARDICKAGKERNTLQPVIPNQRVLKAELQWAAEHEMAETVSDVIGNRTRLAFIDPRATKSILSEIVEEIGAVKNWNIERKIAEFEEASTFLDSMMYQGTLGSPDQQKRQYVPVAV